MNLKSGLFRLWWLVSIVVFFITCSNVSNEYNNTKEGLFAGSILFVLSWILYFLIVWIIKGFNKKNP